MKNKEKTIEECRANIQEFANRFKLIFEDEGECGFGRECVGITNGSHWVDYNPTDSNFEYLPEFYDKRLYDIVPEKAYHKHDCLAVLGREDDSIRQLSDWVDKLNELKATVGRYETGAKDFLTAMLQGTHVNAIKIPK